MDYLKGMPAFQTYVQKLVSKEISKSQPTQSDGKRSIDHKKSGKKESGERVKTTSHSRIVKSPSDTTLHPGFKTDSAEYLS